MSWSERITMGLERQKRIDGKPLDFNEMRKAIFMGQRDGTIISQCMRSADYNGLSAEDRYTLLAYEALVALETYWKMALDVNMKSPIPPNAMRTSDGEVGK